MIEHLVARSRAEGLACLEASVGDGEALDFADRTFDVALSLNGVSLFPDIAAGLREMVRVTRAGGHVLVVVFGPVHRAEFIAFPLGALRSVVPASAPPPTSPPMPPFRLADPAALRGALQTAGLGAVRTEACTWDMSFESAPHLLDTVVSSNPIARRLLEDLTGSSSSRSDGCWTGCCGRWSTPVAARPRADPCTHPRPAATLVGPGFHHSVGDHQAVARGRLALTSSVATSEKAGRSLRRVEAGGAR